MASTSDAGPQEGNTSLFAVFALALSSLVLVPYTLVRLARLSAPDDEERPWETVSVGRACGVREREGAEKETRSTRAMPPS